MSTTQPTYRRVPREFEQYLVDRGARPVPAQRCTGCLRDAGACWQEDGPNVYCEACLRHQYGYEQEEENVVFAAVDGLVRGLFEQGVPLALVRAACEDAIERAQKREQETWVDAIERFERYGSDAQDSQP